MPWRGWRAVLLRTWTEVGDDNIGLVSAGISFYGFLALVPLLGAVVLSYGLVADPSTVIEHVRSLMSVMPADAAKLIGEQLLNVVATSGEKKGFGLLLALALALFGARNAAGAIITGLNIAYGEKERRSFFFVNALALGITAAGVAVMVLAAIWIAALGHLEEMFPTMPNILVVTGKLASYGLLVLAGAAGAATLYRYGPSREKPRWVWLTPGSLLSAMLGLALTFGFGIYVANFGNYNATYGSLGAVVVMLTWLYLTSYVLLFGAELNAELEYQTATDTTSGKPAPLGERGAWGADHVAGRDPAPQKVAETLEAGQESNQPAIPRSSYRSSDIEQSFVPNPRTADTDGPPFPVRLIAIRVGARLSHLVGGRRAGLLASTVCGIGLSRIRGPGSSKSGVVMILVAVVMSYRARKAPNRNV